MGPQVPVWLCRSTKGRRGEKGENTVLLSCRATSPAPDSQIVSEIQQVLDRRGSMKHAPVTVAVSDAVALGIAAIFSSPTDSGQVLERFSRRGSIDSSELLEAV